MDEFYALNVKAIWRHFKSEHFSFWMICGYLFIEYVRPQSIIRGLDFLPWAQVFLLLSLAGWMANGRAKWVSDPTNKWMLLFFLVIIASGFNAYFPQTSWDHLKDFYGWLIIYFLIINIIDTRKRLFIFLFIFLVSSFKLSSHGARTWAMRGFAFTDWGLAGPSGFFQNSGELAIQMLMFSPIAYRMAVFMKPWLSKRMYWLMMAMPITGAMTVMGASSRGGQIGLAVQIYQALLKGRLSFKTILLVGIVGVLGYLVLPDEQRVRFTHIGDDRTSQQRLLYWRHGMDMIKENPTLGVGYFNFAPYYQRYYSGDMLYTHAELPHNIFIQVGTDAGYIGLAVFLMLIYRNFKSTADGRRLAQKLEGGEFYIALSRGLDTAFTGFLIAGQFVTVTYYPFMWINLAFSVALVNVVKREIRAQNERPEENFPVAANNPIERVPV